MILMILKLLTIHLVTVKLHEKL